MLTPSYLWSLFVEYTNIVAHVETKKYIWHSPSVCYYINKQIMSTCIYLFQFLGALSRANALLKVKAIKFVCSIQEY